jgi:hypothetical protein
VWKRRLRDHWLGALWASAVALLSEWWRVDRIRSSPREGRLLRIGARCVLRVGADFVLVQRRSVGHGKAGPFIIYECIGDRGPGELWVTPIGDTHRPTTRWVEGGCARELAEEQIEVFQPPGAQYDSEHGRAAVPTDAAQLASRDASPFQAGA